MKHFLIGLLAIGLMAPSPPLYAQTSPIFGNVVSSCGTTNGTAYAAGTDRPVTQDTNGNVCTGAVITPSGTQNVNVVQQSGNTNATGNGVTTTGTQRVTISSDSTGTVIATQPTAASLNATVVGTGTFVTQSTLQAGTNNVGLVTPAPSATVGWTTQSCTVACASTLVSGAHTLGDAVFSATVTGWLLIYDATSCTANGTVTPKKAYAYTTANVTIGLSWADIPVVNATGIAACFSSTGPYTATASTTAFISVDYK